MAENQEDLSLEQMELRNVSGLFEEIFGKEVVLETADNAK